MQTKLKQLVAARLEQTRRKVASSLASDIHTRIVTEGTYPAFKDSVTVRKNKSAPMPVAEGATRDLVDSGRLARSVHATDENNVGIGGGLKYGLKIEEYTGVFSQAVSDVNLREAIALPDE